jgi:phage terminase large subunit
MPLDGVNFDWKAPDYAAAFKRRAELLQSMRAMQKKNPKTVPGLMQYYRLHPAQFINDWGFTMDPRNPEVGLPAVIPFLLFPRQEEWVEWVVERWHGRQAGLTEKTRDMGMSWLSVALACTLCLLNKGLVIGFGSRKEIYVDQIGSPKSLFERARLFLSHLPPEFLGGWNRSTHAPYMRIMFPGTGSYMQGEAGDNIGRGDRASIYFVDESAFLERPQLVEASLSNTTNCRIDISTPNGMANPFAQKRFAGRIPLFTFHWQSDPRKDDAWYAKMKAELDPVTMAQEIDIDYLASVEGVVIPSAWVIAAIGANERLGLEPSGGKWAALDVADEGIDKNALAVVHGGTLLHLEEWSGVGSDIYGTVQRTFHVCDGLGVQAFKFDSDGLGAGVRGDARAINEGRQFKIMAEPFRGSAQVIHPDGMDVPPRKNVDYFANAKAQAWWRLRLRFQETHRAMEGHPYEADKIISIPSDLPTLDKLRQELSQPTYDLNVAGKIVIDKTPDGMPSPNLADAVMIAFSSAARTAMRISTEAVDNLGRPTLIQKARAPTPGRQGMRISATAWGGR